MQSANCSIKNGLLPDQANLGHGAPKQVVISGRGNLCASRLQRLLPMATTMAFAMLFRAQVDRHHRSTALPVCEFQLAAMCKCNGLNDG